MLAGLTIKAYIKEKARAGFAGFAGVVIFLIFATCFYWFDVITLKMLKYDGVASLGGAFFYSNRRFKPRKRRRRGIFQASEKRAGLAPQSPKSAKGTSCQENVDEIN